jgi:RNA polymerase subunit RPABC4/transcription elongation factor Spt4
MPVFGMLSLLAGIVLFVFTNIHAPEDAFPGGRWVYKPEFYYSFIIISLGFVFYGLYEIATELRSTGKRRRTSTPIIDPPKTCPSCQEILSFMARFCPHCGRAVQRSDESSCPRCGYIGSAGARFCELCGHVMTSPAPGAVGASAPVPVQSVHKVCGFSSPAAIVTGLVVAIFLGTGLCVWWQYAPLQTWWAKRHDEVQQAPNTKTSPLYSEKSPRMQNPAPLPRESQGPFQVGSEWAIDWQSKYQYQGMLRIKGQLAPDQYVARITVSFTTKKNNRKTVSMDGLVTIRGQEVIINCRNPSVSWWDTDDFYLEWQQNTMTGFNIDKKGRRGQAVFTLVEGAQETL